MADFWRMVSFEYRKILRKRSTLITAGICLFSIFLLCLMPTLTMNQLPGNLYESGYEAIQKDKSYSLALTGREINTEFLTEAWEAYSKIPETESFYTLTPEYETYARPYDTVFNMLCAAFQLEGLEDFKKLTVSDLEQFYERWFENQRTSIIESPLSESEKSATLETLAQVKTPFVYSYTGASESYMSFLFVIGLLICLFCTVCLAPLFSGEYAERTDSLLLSTRYGKSKLAAAKLFTGMSLTVLTGVCFQLLAYALLAAIYGAEGTDAQIQILTHTIWPITLGQANLLRSFLAICANLISSLIVIFLSSKFKAPYFVVIIISVLTIAGIYMNIPMNYLWAYRLADLLPVRILSFQHALNFDMIHLFGITVPYFAVIPLFALFAGAILLPCAYQIFREHQC